MAFYIDINVGEKKSYKIEKRKYTIQIFKRFRFDYYYYSETKGKFNSLIARTYYLVCI